MEKAKLVLEYLRLLFSAPIIAFVAFIVFLCQFREDIKALFGRTAKISFGVGELFTSQIEKAKEELPSKGEPPPIAPATGIGEPNQQGSGREIKDYKDRYEAERAKAYLWEYRYLNYFLARTTQTVLDWLSTLTQRTTISAMDTYLMAFIPNQQERRAILDALQGHYLIWMEGDLIEITPKGREYIAWRGPLQQQK